DLELHDMMGFTEPETMDLLRFASVAEEDMPRIIRDLRDWYDGYRFNPDAPHRLYNPEMVIYFASHYKKYKSYPEELLDENIASDYNKLRRMLQVGGAEMGFATMEAVM
ncbi:AAA family ATPase, partial [Arthrospira platensis SPKY1]|nr:AAA family ATPase [Arthrospira platensis SPKY1]